MLQHSLQQAVLGGHVSFDCCPKGLVNLEKQPKALEGRAGKRKEIRRVKRKEKEEEYSGRESCRVASIFTPIVGE
ncbi:hypothetical protein TIFTF001_035854 [Ficus carica]|uniref:Uncharacterized protein n=1 Tax=Ficus carica TaxID=3494 RepID=A0AA88JAL1_FICCA|nr:hypothetical protein TIFTF001_035854 [Ficus carica]